MDNKKLETLKNSERYKFSSKKDQKKMIENLESKITRYINEIDALADQVTELDKNVVAVGEQIKSLNIETQDLSPIKNDIVAIQTSIAGINSSIDIMYDDVQSLKNKNDNPLAN